MPKHSKPWNCSGNSKLLPNLKPIVTGFSCFERNDSGTRWPVGRIQRMRPVGGGTAARIRGDPRTRVVRSFARASGGGQKRTFHRAVELSPLVADAIVSAGSRRMPRARQIARPHSRQPQIDKRLSVSSVDDEREPASSKGTRAFLQLFFRPLGRDIATITRQVRSCACSRRRPGER